MKKRLIPQDQKLKDWLKKGGREGAKQNFKELLKKAAQPLGQPNKKTPKK